MEAPRPSILGGYRSGLRSVLGASATAYGYTLTVGPSSMLLTGAYGPPKPFEVRSSSTASWAGRYGPLHSCWRGTGDYYAQGWGNTQPWSRPLPPFLSYCSGRRRAPSSPTGRRPPAGVDRLS